MSAPHSMPFSPSLGRDLPPVMVAIPARMGSVRLPGKPLAEIAGVPLVGQVWRRGREGAALLGADAEVLVAADAPEICAAVEALGGRAVLTEGEYASGTDRIAAALEQVDGEGRYEIVVNLQGDMPDFPPEGLARVVAALTAGEGADMATLAAPLFPEAMEDENAVKILCGERADGCAKALDFRREASADVTCCYHVGVYAWRREALRRLVALPPSAREVAERLEQLRALENGFTIAAGWLDAAPIGVDTPADLEAARERFRKGEMG